MKRRGRPYANDPIGREQYELRMEENKEIEFKEKNVAGWSRWDLACLGAGGEGNLIEEMKENRLKELSDKIKGYEYNINCIVEDPTSLYEIKEKREVRKKELVEKHSVYQDGEKVYFCENRYWRDIYEMDEEMGWNDIRRAIEEYEGKDIYTRELKELYLKKERLENVSTREELYKFH